MLGSTVCYLSAFTCLNDILLNNRFLCLRFLLPGLNQMLGRIITSTHSASLKCFAHVDGSVLY